LLKEPIMYRSMMIVVALTFAGAAAAQAEESVVRVDISNLDLRKPEDAAKVYDELSQAARQVCEAAGHQAIASLEAERFDSCFRSTLDEVVARSSAYRLDWLNRQAMLRLYGR
jgi:UrcA family protein